MTSSRSLNLATLSLAILCCGCVVAPYDDPGPAPPAYGYAGYPAAYPWATGVDLDIYNGYGRGWYGGYRGGYGHGGRGGGYARGGVRGSGGGHGGGHAGGRGGR